MYRINKMLIRTVKLMTVHNILHNDMSVLQPDLVQIIYILFEQFNRKPYSEVILFFEKIKLLPRMNVTSSSTFKQILCFEILFRLNSRS